MSRERDPKVRLLRWYPSAWRDRYGEEFLALMEDDLGGRDPGALYRLRVIGSGIHQRARHTGLVGVGATKVERQRAGSLLVLVAWNLVVLAAASFSKESEHFAGALVPHSRLLPQVTYDVVVALGVVGTAIVLAGFFLSLPSFARYLRGGGWPAIRNRVLVAGSLLVATLVAVVPLAAWAHHLGVVQRNGGDLSYTGAFLGWALLAGSSIVAWTVVAVASARRVTLSLRVLAVESRLAVALAGVMVALLVSTVVWWVAMVTRSPGYIYSSPLGSNYYAFDFQSVITLGAMAAAALLSGFGAYRVMTARENLDAGSGPSKVTST